MPKPLLLATALLCCSSALRAEPPFDVAHWPQWAQAEWAAGSQPAEGIAVSFDNQSPLASDEALFAEADSTADIESGGVPLTALQAWLEWQLEETGIARRSHTPRYQLQVSVLDYRPLYTAEGEPGFWRDTKSTFTRWYEEYQQPGLYSRIHFSARLTDRYSGHSETIALVLKVPACARLQLGAHLPAALHTPFHEHYRRALVGQLSIAALQRITHWSLQRMELPDLPVPLTFVGSSRIEIPVSNPESFLRRELTVYHRDDGRELAQLQVSGARAGKLLAYPLDRPPGALRSGDFIRLPQATPDLLRFPAEIVYGDQCRPKPEEPKPALEFQATAPEAPPEEAAPEAETPEIKRRKYKQY